MKLIRCTTTTGQTLVFNPTSVSHMIEKKDYIVLYIGNRAITCNATLDIVLEALANAMEEPCEK